MFVILPCKKKIAKKIVSYKLQKKFQKQIKFLSQNPQHPSLHLELLEPKKYGLYSFRIDQKFRALYFFHPDKKSIPPKFLDIPHLLFSRASFKKFWRARV